MVHMTDRRTRLLLVQREKENYDVAIHLTESDLVGMKVEGIRIPVSSLEGISRIKGWMTEALKRPQWSERAFYRGRQCGHDDYWKRR